jgi:hypothetical protein
MRLVFFLLILFSSFVVTAQKKIAYDTTTVQQRNFSPPSVNTYRNNKNFQYDKELIETPSLWDRFWDWVWNKYEELMSTETGQVTMKILFWLFGFGAVAFFISRVMKMSRMNLFSANEQRNLNYTIEDENIHAIEFEAAIQQALQDGNYRLAIRLLYLQSLKILTDKNFINWQPNKTNTDYLYEIKKQSLLQPFKSITYVFEYAWYGNKTVNREDYSEMKEEFLKFQSQL